MTVPHFHFGFPPKSYCQSVLNQKIKIKKDPKIAPRKKDPRKTDSRKKDPRKIDPRKIDPRKIDPRKKDPRILEFDAKNEVNRKLAVPLTAAKTSI